MLYVATISIVFRLYVLYVTGMNTFFQQEHYGILYERRTSRLTIHLSDDVKLHPVQNTSKPISSLMVFHEKMGKQVLCITKHVYSD